MKRLKTFLASRTKVLARLAHGYDLAVVAAGTKDVRRCEEDPKWALALSATPVRAMLISRFPERPGERAFEGCRSRES